MRRVSRPVTYVTAQSSVTPIFPEETRRWRGAFMWAVYFRDAINKPRFKHFRDETHLVFLSLEICAAFPERRWN